MCAQTTEGLVDVPSLSEAQRSFYVPQFEVRIENAGLPQDVLRDIQEITYEDDVDQLDSFSMVVSNVDDIHHSLPARDRSGHRQRRFKYIGSEQAEELEGGEAVTRYKLFEPCARNVELRMGYVGHLQLMTTANFTTMAPRFTAGGASTLEVRGLNVLHQLRRRKYSEHWTDKTRSEVAELVGRRRRRGNDDTRLDLPLCINDRARSLEHPLPILSQKNEYDIDFLWKLARAEGYVVVIREETDSYPRHIYFGPAGGASSCARNGGGQQEWQEPTVHLLEWGKSLIECTPRITSANQFMSVTVRGWNRRRQREISKTVTLDDRELQRMNPDLHEMINVCDPREERVVDLPVFDEREAENRARAIFIDQLRQMVKLNATTVGLPGLRAGSTVDIAGLGSRLSGRYFITKTSHTINNAGYLTKFEARREHDPGAG